MFRRKRLTKRRPCDKIVKQMFGFQHAWGNILKNQYIPPRDFDRIMRHVQSDYRPLFILAAETGFRIDDVLKNSSMASEQKRFDKKRKKKKGGERLYNARKKGKKKQRGGGGGGGALFFFSPREKPTRTKRGGGPPPPPPPKIFRRGGESGIFKLRVYGA